MKNFKFIASTFICMAGLSTSSFVFATCPTSTQIANFSMFAENQDGKNYSVEINDSSLGLTNRLSISIADASSQEEAIAKAKAILLTFKSVTDQVPAGSLSFAGAAPIPTYYCEYQDSLGHTYRLTQEDW